MKKVLFIASAQAWYVRNVQIIDILKKKYSADFIVSQKKNYPFRIIEVLTKFIFKQHKNKYNFIFVGFLAQALIPFIRLFYKGQIIGDFFISIYDTLCFDRQKIKPNSLLAKIIFKYEKFTIKLSDKIITDTQNSKQYLINKFNIDESKVDVLYVLPDKQKFAKQAADQTKPNNTTKVFFYGTGQPLHGIDTILKTIHNLRKENIEFVLIGPLRKKYKDTLDNLDLSKVKFIDWVDYKEIPNYIKQSDICLGGHFGTTAKARRVIAGKTFQFMLMQKPVILGDNPANKELFTNDLDCIMVDMGNSEVLSQAILKLKSNPELRQNIAHNAYNTITKIYQLNTI